MNEPDRYSKFVLQDGVRKLDLKADTKLEHAATFAVMHEDHTLGNLLRMQLHRNKNVVFAGYQIPHPLVARMVVKLQTNGNSPPETVMCEAIQDLKTEVESIQRQMESEFARIKMSGGGGMGMGMQTTGWDS